LQRAHLPILCADPRPGLTERKVIAMRLRHILVLSFVLATAGISQAADSHATEKEQRHEARENRDANSAATIEFFGFLQAVAVYCDQITEGKRIDVVDVMKYLSSGTGNDPSCASCRSMVADVKNTKLFKSTYESALSELAKIDKTVAMNACSDIQRLK
jgi:hypothetical protein